MNAKALYVRRIDERTSKKIDRISKETGFAKTIIVNKLLSDALGVPVKNNLLDLKRWVK